MTRQPDDRYSPRALGEDLEWGRLLPHAWQMVRDPEGHYEAPPEPDPNGPLQGDAFAWWTPLLHLATYGLGWAQPGRGLQQWLAAGRPTEHPILRVVDEWWGPAISDFIGWSYTSSVAGLITEAVLDVTPGNTFVSRPLAPARASRWFVSDSSDDLHLTDHSHGPLEVDAQSTVRRISSASNGRLQVALLTDSATGWYRELLSTAREVPHGSPSPQVDVVVEPLGWLGTYRRSRESGLWFTGQHRWHQLGL